MIDFIKHIPLNYDTVIFLAPNDITDLLQYYQSCGIHATAIDYDPKFAQTDSYINKDFVFDQVDLNAQLIVHMNIEKTYPIDLPKDTDVILVGDDLKIDGNCTHIDSCDKIIQLYNISTVYKQGCVNTIKDKIKDKEHFYVYGKK